MDYIRAIEAEQINENLPKFNVGDTVSVHYCLLYTSDAADDIALV